MDKKQYYLLAENLDKILLNNNANFYTHSISWLFLIKEHPIFSICSSLLFFAKGISIVHSILLFWLIVRLF